MTVEITSYITGDVIYVTELSSHDDERPHSWRLGKAAIQAIRDGRKLMGAHLYGACLRGADLQGANLRGSDLRRADLRDTNLRRANLRNADLRGADLEDAILHGADLGGPTIIDAGQEKRGYRFVAIPHEDGIRIAAGCRWFTIAEARAHWGRDIAPSDAECLARIEMIARVARSRGWVVGDEGDRDAAWPPFVPRLIKGLGRPLVRRRTS